MRMNIITYIVTPKEIKKLYKKFSKLDTDKSGELEPEEFFDVPGFYYSLNYNKSLINRVSIKSFSEKSYINI